MKNGEILKGIFFDFDGTLVNSINLMYEAYESFLEEHKSKPSKNEFDNLNGPPLSIVVRKLKINHMLQHSDEFLLNRYNEIVDKFYVNATLNNGADELINSAFERSIVLAIVTSNSKQRVQNFLTKTNLTNKFSFIITGEDVILGKPHPEPYLLALLKANLSYSEVIAIEDSEQGANSALSARIKTYMLDNNIEIKYPIKTNISHIKSLSSLNKILFN